jgi:hypothetical protein
VDGSGYHLNMTLNMTAQSMLDEEGNLERPFETRAYLRPASIELDGDTLVWANGRDDEGMWQRRRQPGKGMLEGFIVLANARPEGILRYARKWGVLDLCHHGLPHTHNAAPPPFGPVPTEEEYRAIHAQCLPALREPLAIWRRYSAQMGALLKLAAQFYAEDEGEPLDTEWLRDYGLQGWKRSSRATAFSLLANPLDRWLSDSGVRHRLKYPEGERYSTKLRRVINPKRPTIIIGGPGAIVSEGLFGNLVIQLLLAITDSRGYARCSHCGNWYSPTRAPNARRRNFCARCRASGVPDMLAHQDARARHRLIAILPTGLPTRVETGDVYGH